MMSARVRVPPPRVLLTVRPSASVGFWPRAGDPVKPMDKELYASIMLYTGNAIYRDLNQVRPHNHCSITKKWHGHWQWHDVLM